MKIARSTPIVLALTTALAYAGEAAAAPVCSTPEEFVTAVQQQGIFADSGTLTFTVTGLPYAGIEKHHLVSIADGRKSDGGGNPCVLIDFKSWGEAALPADVGTVKEELGNGCCVSPDCDQCYGDRDGATICTTWAGPRPSDVAFTGPEQTCDITLTVTPDKYGYNVACTPGVSFGYEDVNRYAMAITDVRILITEIATVTNAKFCYEPGVMPPPGPGDPIKITAIEDVTVSPSSPNTVYPVPTDLVVGTEDGQIFLKFDLKDIDGKVTSATLHMHGSMDPSADGDGGDVFAVSDVSWSEKTLVWSAKPPTTGVSFGHLPGPKNGNWLSIDVSAALSDPGVYAFSIVPGPADSNGAHYDSKEVSAAAAPYLEVKVEPSQGTSSTSGTSDSGGSGGGGSTSAPGTASGSDGNSGGVTVTGADTSSSSDSGVSGVSGVSGLSGFSATGGDDGSSGCACRSGSSAPTSSAAWLLLIALAGRRRSTRSPSSPTCR